MDVLKVLIALAIVIGRGIFWAAMTESVASNKGQSSGVGWMIGGFLFGVYAFAVACSLPDLTRTSAISEDSSKGKRGPLPVIAKKKEQKGAKPVGNWKCTCGKENPSYVTTCTCGVDRMDVVTEDSLIDDFEMSEKFIECPNCNARNPIENRRCEKCNEYLPTRRK